MAVSFNPSAVKHSVPSSRRRAFGTPTAIDTSNEAIEVPIQLIDPYTAPDGGPQPFRLYSEEQMKDMVDSIRQNGVLTPVLLRPMEVEHTLRTIDKFKNRLNTLQTSGFYCNTVCSLIKPRWLSKTATGVS